jgi:DNA-binding transcriptional LysR family regulator
LKLDCKMDEFKPYAVFAETVAAGSMSAAARRLGMSPSAISQIIRALERQAVRILPQWLQNSMPVTAVTPQRDREPAKVRLAVEALKRYFQPRIT